MPIKQIISILALSAMISLPAEIATAGNIKVNNGNTRVRVYKNGNVRVNRGYKKRTYAPRKRVYRSRYSPYRRSRWSRYRNRRYKRNVNCSYQSSTSRSSSGSRSSYKHSSRSTCK